MIIQHRQRRRSASTAIILGCLRARREGEPFRDSCDLLSELPRSPSQENDQSRAEAYSGRASNPPRKPIATASDLPNGPTDASSFLDFITNVFTCLSTRPRCCWRIVSGL